MNSDKSLQQKSTLLRVWGSEFGIPNQYTGFKVALDSALIVKHIFNGVHIRTPCWYTEFFSPTLYMALFAFLLFCYGSPSWRRSLSFGLLLFLKASLTCLCMTSGNISPLIFPKYCSLKITPLLKDIATIKCAILQPSPVWLPFVVYSGSKPSLYCC